MASFAAFTHWTGAHRFGMVHGEGALMKAKTRGLWEAMSRMLQHTGYQDQVKQHLQDFSRQRKIGFVSLMAIILNMVRRTTQVELDEFREKFMPEEAAVTSYTKQSFSEARQKLRPEAFTLLNDAFIQKFYADDDYKTFKGFRLLAIDGSVIEIPNTPELRTAYGVATGTQGFAVARARASHIIDVENHLVIHATLGRYDSAERDLAQINIETLLRLVPHAALNLLLFDRGYPSLAFLHDLTVQHLKYVMRVSTAFYHEVLGTATPDETVTILVTAKRARKLKRQGTPVPKGTGVTLRVLKVELPTGETEILITNLTPDELSYAEAKPLYFKRWGVETHYGDVKHKFEVENFSGKTPLVIAQDYHATILLANMASVIEQDAQEEWEARRDQVQRKYAEYKINTNILVGKMKHRLMAIILEDDPQKQETAYGRLIADLTRNILPIIPGRSSPRKKAPKANKYSPSKRRCL